MTYNGHDAVFIHGGYNGDEVRLCPALACCVGFSQQGVLVLCWRDTTTNALARCVALIGVQAMNDAFVLDLVERKWLKISDAYMSTPCAGMAVLCSQQFSLAGAGAGGVQTQIQTRTQHFRPPPPPSPFAGHAVTELDDDAVLVFGGGDNDGHFFNTQAQWQTS